MPRPFASHTVETTVLPPWQDPLAMAAPTPWRAWEAMVGDDALQRHAIARYAQLRSLPRRVRRALQRKLALPLTGVALLLALGQEPSQAATTWTVCASGCAYTTIQAAINAAITVAGDLIAVRDAVYTEAGISVTKDLSIVGQGADSTVVQAAATPFTASTRVFTIVPGVTVTIQGLTIRHGTLQGVAGGGVLNEGSLTLTNSTVSGNSSWGDGGGIRNVGTLTLTHSTISRNSSSYGGGINNSGTLTLTNSTVSYNSSSYGGGIDNSGTMTLTHSTINTNWAYLGGGIDNSGMLTLTNSTVSGNYAGYRPGAILNGGMLTLTNSTISGNRGDYGPAIDNSGMLTLTNSTVSGNSAGFGPGGILNGGTLTLTNSTISNNQSDYGPALLSSGMLTLTNSIVANNLLGGDCLIAYATSLGYNLDSDGSCQLTAPTDQPGVDPKLGPLQDNGGPTFTHALLPDSPALDAIPWGTNGCGTTISSDQRWQARPQALGGACDIGAYEVEAAGQTLAAWVTGLTPSTAVCQNATTGQVVTFNDPSASWDCEAAGLGVNSGDRVTLRVRGAVEAGATDVGGAATGLQPSSGSCTNFTTGQRVKFQGMRGGTAVSCVAAGLTIHPGDAIQISAQGVAE